VGHLAARIFDRCGYEVTAVDPLESRRRLATETGLPDVREAVPVEDEAVAGHVALVLECSGHERAVLDACKTVCRLGEVVLVGVPWIRRTDLTAHDVLDLVFHRYVLLRSGWEWDLPRHDDTFCTSSLYGNFAAALRWLGEGKITVGGLYDVASPRDAQAAYQSLLNHNTDRLTVVFDWARLEGASSDGA
jgi:threonine dehydrogenase-like Zn-dependent dehydrogenase